MIANSSKHCGLSDIRRSKLWSHHCNSAQLPLTSNMWESLFQYRCPFVEVHVYNMVLILHTRTLHTNGKRSGCPRLHGLHKLDVLSSKLTAQTSSGRWSSAFSGIHRVKQSAAWFVWQQPITKHVQMCGLGTISNHLTLVQPWAEVRYIFRTASMMWCRSGVHFLAADVL